MGPPLDLKSQDSVKKFGAAINKRPGQLNILVNNAGLGYTPKSFTEQGVGMLTQVWAKLCLGYRAATISSKQSWVKVMEQQHSAASRMSQGTKQQQHQAEVVLRVYRSNSQQREKYRWRRASAMQGMRVTSQAHDIIPLILNVV